MRHTDGSARRCKGHGSRGRTGEACRAHLTAPAPSKPVHRPSNHLGQCLESFGACVYFGAEPYFSTLFAMQISALLYAAVLCYQTRLLPLEYAEGHWIFMYAPHDLVSRGARLAPAFPA